MTVHELRGAVLARQGRPDEAKRAYDRALSMDPSSRAALLGLARLARTPADARQVRARVDKRPGGIADDGELVLAQARLSWLAGDRERAERELRQSLALDPSDIANFGLLARLYREEHRLDAARAEFDAIAAKDPANISARTMAAVLTHALGQVPDAQKRYEDVLRANPRISVAANDLAGIFADAGERLDEAQQLAESAVRMLPANADTSARWVGSITGASSTAKPSTSSSARSRWPRRRPTRTITSAWHTAGQGRRRRRKLPSNGRSAATADEGSG